MGRRLGPANAEKRRAILEAAAVLVAERGREVSLAEICSRAGVSRQTIYNHHGDKQGLFDAVAAQGFEPFPCCLASTDLPPEVLLSRYAATLLEWAYATRHVTVLRACCRGLETWDKSFGARSPAIHSLAEILRQATQRGRLSVRDPPAAAALFLDLVLSGPQLQIALGAQEPPSCAEIEARSRHCARLFVRGCGEPRTSRRPPSPERRRAPRRRADDTMSPPTP